MNNLILLWMILLGYGIGGTIHALTGYCFALTTSLICTTIFEGCGLATESPQSPQRRLSLARLF